MAFTTTTVLAMGALLLIAGWFLGLASHPGGRKWKDRYLAERDAHATNRKTWEAEHRTLSQQADERTAATRAGIDERDTVQQNRIAELERENDRLRRASPVTAQTIAPRAQTAARPAYTADGHKRGWFDFGAPRTDTPTNG